MKRHHILLVVSSFLMTMFPPTAPVSSQPVANQPSVSLINQGGEATVYIGVFLIIVVSTVIIGVLSQRVEEAVLMALGLSLISIAILFL